MSLSVVALQQPHLEEAANLVLNEYDGQREIVSALPCWYDSLELIVTRLSELLDRLPGAAALRGDKLVGFVQGMLIPSMNGRRSAYAPEWGHAADANPVQTYQAMYDYLALRWVQQGCCSHVVTLFCRPTDVTYELFRYGFGMLVIDAVRDLSPVEGDVAKVQIRKACPDDSGVLMEFEESLTEHLASAPIFRWGGQSPEADEVEKRLRDPDHLHLLACEDRQVLGYMGFGRQRPDPPRSSSMTGLSHVRGRTYEEDCADEELAQLYWPKPSIGRGEPAMSGVRLISSPLTSLPADFGLSISIRSPVPLLVTLEKQLLRRSTAT